MTESKYEVEIKLGIHLDRYTGLRSSLDNLNYFRPSSIEDRSEIINEMLQEANLLSESIEQLLGFEE